MSRIGFDGQLGASDDQVRELASANEETLVASRARRVNSSPVPSRSSRSGSFIMFAPCCRSSEPTLTVLETDRR